MSGVDPVILENCVIHILHQGFPLCGFSLKFPVRWPAGHLWIGIDDQHESNCEACLGVARSGTAGKKENENGEGKEEGF